MTPPKIQQRTILLVEDDDSQAGLITLLLMKSSSSSIIERVPGGRQAIAYLEQAAAMPDAILLDLKMPDLDGHQVLETIKNDPRWKTIPTVIFTSSDADADRLQAYDKHANGYMVKPINFQRLKELLEGFSRYWMDHNYPPPQDSRSTDGESNRVLSKNS